MLISDFLPQFLSRISVFNFIVDEHVATPTITFTGEEPYLQYVSCIRILFEESRLFIVLLPVNRIMFLVTK